LTKLNVVIAITYYSATLCNCVVISTSKYIEEFVNILRTEFSTIKIALET